MNKTKQPVWVGQTTGIRKTGFPFGKSARIPIDINLVKTIKKLTALLLEQSYNLYNNNTAF